MDYEKHYNLLIDRARDRLLAGYVERHHIIPRCMAGSNDTSNIVELTAEEHYVAHQLLVKIYKETKYYGKLVYAIHRMAASKRCNNKFYGWLRRKHATQVAKDKIGNTWNRGKPKTKEHKQKISETLSGRSLSEAHKRNISLAKIGRKLGQRKRREFVPQCKKSERELARMKGKVTYLTGVPCKRGHISPRYVVSSNCIECKKIRERTSMLKTI